jgi:hypothetical protein
VSEAERTAAMEIRSGISQMANTKRLGFVARLGSELFFCWLSFLAVRLGCLLFLFFFFLALIGTRKKKED